MCRFLVYKGNDEILLSKLILEPQHSILTQSYDSRLRRDHRRPHNGDGFGVGYFTDPKFGPEPCIFTSTIPAWNCTNLERLASKTCSALIFAHVRATTEGNLSDQNCHPFSHHSLMWMHNGGIGGFEHVKRRLALRLGERWFMTVKGSTDSEWAFALFLDSLSRMGVDPDRPPTPHGFGHATLRRAMLETIRAINELTAAIPSDVEPRPVSLLNFAITDGHTVVCSKYASSRTDAPASLFFSSGTSWIAADEGAERKQYRMERRDRGADIVLVASEPLTFEKNNWVAVPNNSTITIHKQTVMIHPIIDEFYNHVPIERSPKLAQSMYQTIQQPTSSAPPHPSSTPSAGSRDRSISYCGLSNDPINELAQKLHDLKTQTV